MSRPGKHIPMIEKLGSALADKLPREVRDQLRGERVPARQIVSMFTPDHLKLHAWGGEDIWFNLDMRLRGPELKAKDATDTSRAAKADRIDRNNEDARRRLLARQRGEPKPRSRWGSRKIQSRPFQKGHRPLRSRSFQKGART